MIFLRFCLLGEPHIEVDQERLTGFVSTKAQALLIYLVMSSGRHSRNRLANLLWSEFSDDQARNNLRTALSNLRGLVGPHLSIERDAVAYKRDMPYWLDVDVVQETFGSSLEKQAISRIREATALYRGNLLDGFQVRNAPAYEDWVLHQRENLHGLVLRGLSQTADRSIAEGEYEVGLEVTRRLLTLEPWHEQSHRQRLLLLAYTNQRSAAMAQYEVCRSILWEEFGVEPMPETTALFEKIKTSEIAPPIPAPATRVVAHGWLGRLTGFVRSALTHPDTSQPPPTDGFIDWAAIPDPSPLIGREEEASQLVRWLDTDRSRLIAVHGMGGQGKSALVASVIHSLFGPSAMAVYTQNTHGSQDTYGHRNGVATTSGEFQVVLWHSLATAPDLRQWAHHWIAFLANREIDLSTMSSDELISMIIESMRRWRCLIVLDDVDGILQAEGNAGKVAADQAIYAELFKRVGSSNHQSSLVVISRDSLVDVEGLVRGQERNVKNLWLGPLSSQAAQAWLAVLGVSGDSSVLAEIAERYSGNPLALGLAADTIGKLHFGNGQSFLDSQVVAFDAIRAVIDEQFARLSRLEEEMMGVLALAQKAVTWNDLGQSLRIARPQREIVEAQLSLLRRGLVISQPTGITLPSLILGYMQE